jgi:RNA polymerase sigma-70 factor (ECF subfamily)
MAPQLTIEGLLARISVRDKDALAEVYDRTAPRLLGMLVRILTNRSAAEEVLQQTFLRLWNEARRLGHGQVSSEAWLAVTARKLAIDRLRSERRLPALARGKPDPLDKTTSWLPAPELITLLDGRRELLKRALGQLPKAQHRALELAVFEGYTETEIAQKLGEPLGKVRAGLRAGLTFLRHRLRAVLGTWAAT